MVNQQPIGQSHQQQPAHRAHVLLQRHGLQRDGLHPVFCQRVESPCSSGCSGEKVSPLQDDPDIADTSRPGSLSFRVVRCFRRLSPSLLTSGSFVAYASFSAREASTNQSISLRITHGVGVAVWVFSSCLADMLIKFMNSASLVATSSAQSNSPMSVKTTRVSSYTSASIDGTW